MDSDKHEFSGSLEGHFLVAMPGMEDHRFARTVIYICAHNEEGAMGFVINQKQDLQFHDLLVQLEIISEGDPIKVPEKHSNLQVHNGGPVDRSRGFVLHSGDYLVDSSLKVSGQIYLTATLDLLRAIYQGEGPNDALMVLGYAGWAAGQLENEIAMNGWLICPATASLIFEGETDDKYEAVLAASGIDLNRLSGEAGHA